MDVEEAFRAYQARAARHEKCTFTKCLLDDPTCPNFMVIFCYRCESPEKVVAIGPSVNRADPTQTYKLACGHRSI